MTAPFRTETGGQVDRSRPVRFAFDGRSYEGVQGDTLASALLANGVRIVGRSFKLHRPRGLVGAGVEECNALVQIGERGRSTANLRATEVELFEGLRARAVNCFPSAAFDLGGVNGLLAPFLRAGFYYKTFMLPHWRIYEEPIRHAAGLGRAADAPDPDRYETAYLHCDVLVVGSGPAGLAAALAAGAGGARVVLVEQDFQFGGSAVWGGGYVDGLSSHAWAKAALDVLSTRPETRLMARTCAFGLYDHGAAGLIERLGAFDGDGVRERLWQVRAGRIIVAAGAIERPLVFPGNDRPGVMLAEAALCYLRRFGVLPGRRPSLFTNNDGAYRTARALADAGLRPVMIDARPEPSAAAKAFIQAGGRLVQGGLVTSTRGDPALRFIEAATPDRVRRLVEADCLLMSGGYSPTVHLFKHAGGALRWDDGLSAMLPAGPHDGVEAVGAAAGRFDYAELVRDAYDIGGRAAETLGYPGSGSAPVAAGDPAPTPWPLWRVAGRDKAFVDLQHDVTASDVEQAANENYASVEHLKRYTTLGMAPDQGKTSNVNALALLSQATGRAIEKVGVTGYRPPFTPVTFAAFQGSQRDALFRPIRRTPLHDRGLALGARFEEYGGWMRAAYFSPDGAPEPVAIRREALAVREAAGIFDSSTLGKIEVAGPDAAEFLDLVYATGVSTLKPGRVRYGLMLSETGVVMDDGVCARLAEDRFLVGTTSGGAERIAAWMEEWLQCEWRGLRVVVAPVTTVWAVITLTGPKAREILQAAGVDVDVSADAFKHMCVRDAQVAGVPARLFRVSFTGEVSFEINVPADRAEPVWDALMQVGAPLGLKPVGIEAWMVLRTEKGFLHVGVDTDGVTNAVDAGFVKSVERPVDFIGKRSMLRANDLRSDRLQFVGLEPLDGKAPPVGAHLRRPGGPRQSEGFVTSSADSPTLGRGVALGLLKGGRDRMGEELELTGDGVAPGRVRVARPGWYDPKGERLNG